jgi:Xaa-Pro aminopeptidase
MIHLADNIYLNTNENDRKANLLAVRDYRYAQEMKARYPLHNYKRAAKIMRDLRAIKSPLEVAVLQQAIDITEKTFRRLLKFIKPGVWENQIEAEIYHEFMMNQRDQHIHLSLQVAIEQEYFTTLPITNNARMVNWY